MLSSLRSNENSKGSIGSNVSFLGVICQDAAVYVAALVVGHAIEYQKQSQYVQFSSTESHKYESHKYESHKYE